MLAMAPGASGNRKGSASTIVCSGEFGARPRVCIWCAETCEVSHIRIKKGGPSFHVQGSLGHHHPESDKSLHYDAGYQRTGNIESK